ncbi:MAG: CoA transferase [Gammaproteobacteria bacterium]|nr:CoA transferase [Gammaproteobacteria bacterium]
MGTKADFYKNANPDSSGPLSGVTILEATIAAAGPICATILCDLGAESVKCEDPGAGDMMRQFPPFIGGKADRNAAAWYNSINRGKRAVTLDLRSAEGQALFRRLAKDVDIVVENFTPGTMAAWNLGYDQIAEINPDVIYISISAFGQWGPYSERKGFDPVAQAMTGLMSVTGESDGLPLRTGTVIADNMAGWQGAIGGLAALTHRNATGQGQYVDVSMADAMLNATDFGIMAAANAGFKWQRQGNAIAIGAPMNVYQASDERYVYVIAHLNAHWERLCAVMGRQALIADERTKDHFTRAKHRVFVDAQISSWISELTADDALAQLEQGGVTAAPVLDFSEVAELPQYREHDSVVEIPHPDLGSLVTYGVATKYSHTPASVRGPAPKHGQHNQEIYGDQLGLAEGELDKLKSDGVI